jgi:hypothetical protein
MPGRVRELRANFVRVSWSAFHHRMEHGRGERHTALSHLGRKESLNTMIPHPSTFTALARQRWAEHLAEADGYRLAQCSMNRDGAHRVWRALAAAVLVLALPIVASLLNSWG